MTLTRYPNPNIQNRYVSAAVDAEIENLRRVTSGRASATFRAAAAIGGFVGVGAIDHDQAEQWLLVAALEIGLSEREARSHIHRGLGYGARTPRNLRGNRQPRIPPRAIQHHPPKLDSPTTPPPRPDVEAVWDASRPAGSDPEVAGWFRYRYHDLAGSILDLAEVWDLARAIPPCTDLPNWARSRGGSWTRTGHRIVFRLWDHAGQAVSLRVRGVDPTVAPKSLAPSGFSVKGTVLADPLGVQLLSGVIPEWWHPRRAVISEGEPDWLTWAARHPDDREEGPAYFGVEAGSWSQPIADRIPDGTQVVLRTHHDEPGEGYSAKILKSLGGRCQVYRSNPQGRKPGEG